MENANSLELEEDLPHTRLFWKIKRIVWIILFFIILLAITGLFSNGYLSDQTKELALGNKVKYEKFLRFKRESQLNIDCIPNSDSLYYITLSRSYFEKIQLKEITPLPLFEKQESGKIFYFFSSSSDRIQQVVFALRPIQPGKIHLRISFNGAEETELNQFIYP